ncbi:glycosyltransferase family 4 protein [Rhodothermus marinus]|uniref:Glycosyl transferase group 1 n=1 Tax=Rhodothermus marinus (strain ATCC 43812 / DSM 4252 / R-10) TaxID=518766 RepID=D0MH03_RHOM4|nr:glycosyltransferase family 4 protein [Rhodothermus marinus]ACY47788.1 glycosyl transferase group 1 [Rhodothermus marinus DSM 4252]
MEILRTNPHEACKKYEKRKKIINLVTQMEMGGAQKAAYLICKELIRREYDAEIWFLYKKRPGYEKYGFVKCLYDKKPDNLIEFIRLLLKLFFWMKKARPEGVITYTHYANIIGNLVALIAGISNRMATQHSPSWSYPHLARLLDKLFGTIGVYTSNVYVSESLAESFLNYPKSYKQRSRVIVNGLPTPKSSFDSKEKAKSYFGFSENTIVLSNVGRLSYPKNQLFLLQVISNINDPDVVLVIAGEGELRMEIESEIYRRKLSDRVFLLGELPYEKVCDLLLASDIFVFPSLYESFGYALVEAMMMGLPVIASDIPAHREVVADAGILLSLDDLKEWCLKIECLVRNENKRLELSKKAQLRSQVFELEKMVDGYLKTLFGLK